jgi:carbamate kinase
VVVAAVGPFYNMAEALHHVREHRRVEAAVEFVERRGRQSIIASLDRVAEAASGRAGRRVRAR